MDATLIAAALQAIIKVAEAYREHCRAQQASLWAQRPQHQSQLVGGSGSGPDTDEDRGWTPGRDPLDDEQIRATFAHFLDAMARMSESEQDAFVRALARTAQNFLEWFEAQQR